MQNPHGFFNVTPNSSTAGHFDPSSLPRQGGMTFPPNIMPGDNSYMTNAPLMERPYLNNMARGDGPNAPMMNPAGGMMGPLRMPGIDQHHSASQNIWNSAGQRDVNTEVYRQFQLHRGPEGTPPGSQQQMQFPSSVSGNNVPVGMQFGDAASGQAPDMSSMMIANIISTNLATQLVQNMMTSTPPVLPGLQANPNQFPVLPPVLPYPMLQMIQQMIQAGQQPTTAVPTMSPAPTGGATPIQLPSMDVAKSLYYQLAQHLQQAGQLPNDEFVSLLRPVQSPGSTMVSSTCGIKTEVKKEPAENAFSMARSPDITNDSLMNHITKSEPLVNMKTEDGVILNQTKKSKSDFSGASSSNVYIDVAETALPANHSDDECSDFDVGNEFDKSDDSDDEPLKNVIGVKRKYHKVSKGGKFSSKKHDKAQSMHPSCRKYSAKSTTQVERGVVHTGSLMDGPKKKSHSTTAHAVSVEEGSSRGRFRNNDGTSSSMASAGHRKTSIKEGTKNVRWNPNLRLKECFVKLVRIQIKRDSKGSIVLPKKELSRVARLKQHKVNINVWLNDNDTAIYESGMPKLEPEINVVSRDFIQQSSRSEAPIVSCASKMLSLPVHKPAFNESASRSLKEKSTAVEAVSLQVPVLSNINSSRSPQLRSMYMGLPKDNMEWLSLIGCQRHNSSNRNMQKQYCQCAFCPAVGLMPREVALHIRSEHLELTFALAKIRVSTGSVLYICCRHCDFIAVEPAIIWIHFEIHHSVPGILDSSGNRHVNLSLSIDDPPLNPISLDDILSPLTSFVCFDCGAVVTDRDIHAGSSRLARHVLRRHPNTQNYNGCFVKLLMLQHVEGEANFAGNSVTYRQAIYNEIYERSRREVYVCMLCRYSAFCPYLALSHNLMTHQSKHLMYNCSDCDYQCLSDTDILIHHAAQHRIGSVTTTVTCSVTLVKQSESGIGYVEYSPFDNRKSVLSFVERPPLTTKINSRSKPDPDENCTVQKISHADEERPQPSKKAKVVKTKTEPTRKLARRSSSKQDENPVEKEHVQDDADAEVQSATVSRSENETSNVASLANKNIASASEETLNKKGGLENVDLLTEETALKVLSTKENQLTLLPNKDVQHVDQGHTMKTVFGVDSVEIEEWSSHDKMREERSLISNKSSNEELGHQLAESLPTATCPKQSEALSSCETSAVTDREPLATALVENGAETVHVETSEQYLPNDKNSNSVSARASSILGDLRHSDGSTAYLAVSYVPYVSRKKVNKDSVQGLSLDVTKDSARESSLNDVAKDSVQESTLDVAKDTLQESSLDVASDARNAESTVAVGLADDANLQKENSEAPAIEKTSECISTPALGSTLDAPDGRSNMKVAVESVAHSPELFPSSSPVASLQEVNEPPATEQSFDDCS